MANGGSIRYDIGFNVSKGELNQLTTSLQQIQKMTSQDLLKINPQGFKDVDGELKKIQESAKKLEGALTRAFNPNLGTLNISKFNKELQSIGLDKIYKDFKGLGDTGVNTFRNMTSQVLTTNMQLKQTHNFINNMATTMANTVKWGVASSVMNNFTGSVQQAYGYVKNLDRSLNDIRIVTGMSADEMDRFAEKANKAAKSLGQTTTNYTDAALIYYQQGLNEQEVAARAETTLKAANVTGQSADEVSEQLTAVWNGYKVSAQEAELYIDKLAAVAASTASDLEELSVGMSKVASAANIMGVDVDQLNAMLATTVSVTRQAPESVGTAYKTIFARMGDIEAGLDTETTLGEITEQMNTIAGINVLDGDGGLRDMGKVIEEVGGKWKDLSREQQIALSQAMAGTRQYNNLLSLFDNWDMYTEALNTSAQAAGTLQEQQDTYMESTKAHLNQLKAASEDLYDSLLDADTVNGVADGLTGVVTLLGDFVDSIGGGSGALALLGAVGMRVFNQQLAGGIATFIQNIQIAKENTAKLNAEQEILAQFQGLNVKDARTQELINMKQQVLNLDKAITIEERNQANELIKQQNALYQQQDELNNNLNSAQMLYQELSGISIDTGTDKGRKELTTGLNEELKEFDKYVNKTKEAEQAIRELQKARADYGKVNVQKGSEEETAKLNAEEKVVRLMKERISAAQELDALNLKSLPSQERLSKALAEWDSVMEGSTKTVPKSQTQINALREVLNAFNAVVEEGTGAMKSGSQASDGYKKALENINVHLVSNTANFKNFIQTINLRAGIQQVITFTSSLSQLAMGIQSFQRIGQIWSDDSLTAGEKAIQIMMSASMAATGLSAAFNVASSAKKAYATISTIIGTLQKAENISLIKSLLLLDSAKTKQEKYNAAKVIQSILKEQGIKITQKEIVTGNGKILTDALETIGINKETLATYGLITAMKELLVTKTVLTGIPLWKVLAGGAVAVAAIGLTVYGVQKALNAYDEAAEKASTTAQELADNYNKVNEKLKEFNNLHSDYDSAVASLEDMVKGTEEYSKALNDANEKARTLIETYGLYDDYEIKGGLIEIDEDALASVENKMQNSANQSQNLASMGQIEANNKDTDAAIVNFVRNMESIEGSVHGMSQTLSSAIGKIQEYENLSVEEQLEYGNALKYAQEELGITTGTIEQLGSITSGELAPAFQDLINLINGNEDSSDYELEKIFANNIDELYGEYIRAGSRDENGEIDQVKVEELITAAAKHATQNMSKEDREAYESQSGKILEQTSKINSEGDFRRYLEFQSNFDSKRKDELYGLSWKSDVEIIKEYAKSLDIYTQDQINSITENRNGEITIDGQVDETLNVDTGVALQNIARTEALNAVNESYKVQAESQADFVNAVNSFTESVGGNKGDAIRSAIASTGDLGTADLSSLINMYSEDQLKDLREMAVPGAEGLVADPDKVLQFFGLGSKEDIEGVLNELGANAQELAQKLYDSAGDHDEQAYIDNLNSQADALAETYDMDAEALKNLRDEIQRNAEASEDLNDELADNGEAAQEVAKEITRYEKALKKVSEKQEDWEKALASDSLKDNADMMQELQETYSDFLDLGEDQELSDEFLNNADNLRLMEEAIQGSDEAYSQLMAKAQLDIIEVPTELKLDDEAFNNFMAVAQEKLSLANELLANEPIGVPIDNAQAISAIEELVNAAGWGATAAAQELSKMGYDAEFTEVEKDDVETQESRDLTATISEGKMNVPSAATAEGDILPVTRQVSADSVSYKLSPPSTGTTKSKKKATALKIKPGSLKKNSNFGGNVKINRKNASSPSSGGTGGGGGGGGSSKATKLNKVSKTKKDPLHNVNNRLTRLNKEYSKLNAKREGLLGKDLTKNLQQQLKILEKELVALKKKRELAIDEEKRLKNSIKTTTKNDKNVRTAQFNSEGDLINSYQITRDYEKEINRLTKQYNKMSEKKQKSDAGKALKKRIENLTKNYELVKEQMEEYDDYHLNIIPEIEEAQIEKELEKIEKAIEKKDIILNAKIEVMNSKEALSEFKKEAYEIQGNVLDIAKETATMALNYASGTGLLSKDRTIKTYSVNDDGTIKYKDGKAVKEDFAKADIEGRGVIQTSYKRAKETYDALLAMQKGKQTSYKGNEALALEDLKEYTAELQDGISKVGDAAKEVAGLYEDAMSTVIDAYEKQYDLLEAQLDVLNHAKELSILINGEDSVDNRKFLQEVYDKEKGVVQQQYQDSLAAAEYYRRMMNNEKDAELKAQWEEKYQEELARSNELIVKGAELLKEEYANAIQVAFDTFETGLFNGSKTLSEVQNEWELENQHNERYLDKINSEYEKNKFKRTLEQKISETSSLKAQRELNKLKDEELKKLEEKDKLTKYDLDRANAMYELRLKEIALEEAQQNKTQMRLRRDASGNYSYQFVANQDEVAEKQQEVDNAKNSLYNLDKDELKKNQEEIVSQFNDFKTAYTEAATQEERDAIVAQYEPIFKDLGNDNGQIRANLKETLEETLGRPLTEKEMEEYIPDWNGDIQTFIDKITHSEGGFKEAIMSVLVDSKKAEENYIEGMKKYGVNPEDITSWEDLGKSITTSYTELDKFNKAQDDAITKAKTTAIELRGIRDELDELYKSLTKTNSEYMKLFENVAEFEDANAANKQHLSNSNARKIAATIKYGANGMTHGGWGKNKDEWTTNLSNKYDSETVEKILSYVEQGDSYYKEKDKKTGKMVFKDAFKESNRDDYTAYQMIGKKSLSNKNAKKVAAAIELGIPGKSHAGWGKNKDEWTTNLKKKFVIGTVNKILEYIDESNNIYKVKKKGKWVVASDFKEDERKKYAMDKFDTGGYTGSWSGNQGRIAMLHQKELVLNAQDTERILSAVSLVRDMEGFLNSLNSSLESKIINLTSALGNPNNFNGGDNHKTIEQTVTIEANFPSASNRNEIEEAFKNLVNVASQYAYKNNR